jgi:hypothetical protein
MSYFIFLKYLRSLEEFRKNPHVKIPPKSPCANFQSLGEFKNQIFNSKKSFFFTFSPATLTGPLGLWPSRPHWPSPPAGRSPAHLASQPLSPRVPLAYFTEDVFFFDSRLPFSVPSLYSLTDAWAPLVNSIFSTAPADLGRVTTVRRSPRRPLRTWDAAEPLPPPITPPLTPPSNRALTSLNGPNRHSPPPLLRPPLRRPRPL